MRALGQLVAGVAHEINNPAAFIANNLAHLATLLPGMSALFEAYQPLRALTGASVRAEIEAAEGVVEVEYLWSDLADLVTESQDGIERIRNIVLSLRNFARLDEAELKEADINEGLRSTLALIRPQCKNRIQITESYGILPTTVCHPGQLNQVFLNLLTNAVQAIEGEGQIWVTSACRDDRINVIIRDSGKGMDSATLARLGEPFFTTKPVGAGTGLGLAVSVGIINRHQGQLRFASQPGNGTTVTVELPVTR
ncbi:MAG: ATP-binding protein [Chloroflexi bacterium]|nr:ATP-binding protein [Chloroflexota bacterium]